MRDCYVTSCCCISKCLKRMEEEDTNAFTELLFLRGNSESNNISRLNQVKAEHLSLSEQGRRSLVAGDATFASPVLRKGYR